MGLEYDKIVSGQISERDLCKIKEAVCVQVEKVYDSCKEKDCLEDARVIFKCPEKIRWLLKKAINVKCTKAEVIDIFSDVEPVPFKKGFYTVDVKFFIKVDLNFFVPKKCDGRKIIPVSGLVLFDKKVILFGSEGSIKIFKSHYIEEGLDKPIKSRIQQDNLPISKIEVTQPICLNAKIESLFDKCDDDNDWRDNIPDGLIESLRDEEIDDNDEDILEAAEGDRHISFKRVVVSIGLFSIIKLVRYVQLLIPAFNFCFPNKECVASTDENPCDLFETIEFPFDEFFPPQKFDFPGALEEEANVQEEMEDEHPHHHHGHGR